MLLWRLSATTQAKWLAQSGCLIAISFVPLLKYRASSLLSWSHPYVFDKAPRDVALRGTDNRQGSDPSSSPASVCKLSELLLPRVRVRQGLSCISLLVSCKEEEGTCVGRVPTAPGTCRSPSLVISGMSVYYLFLPLLKTICLGIESPLYLSLHLTMGPQPSVCLSLNTQKD